MQSTAKAAIYTKSNEIEKWMDKAKNIGEFMLTVGRSLEIGIPVRYDLKDLSYGEIHEQTLSEYGYWLDMEELPEDVDEELHDWEIDLVKDTWATMELPDRIDPPMTWIQLEGMADFANEQSVGGRFVRDVQRALDSDHPFGTYKAVMTDYDLIDGWYRFREQCYCDYVRRELDLPRK